MITNRFAFMLFIVDFLFGFVAGLASLQNPGIVGTIWCMGLLIIGLVTHTYLVEFQEKAFKREERKKKRGKHERN